MRRTKGILIGAALFAPLAAWSYVGPPAVSRYELMSPQGPPGMTAAAAGVAPATPQPQPAQQQAAAMPGQGGAQAMPMRAASVPVRRVTPMQAPPIQRSPAQSALAPVVNPPPNVGLGGGAGSSTGGQGMIDTSPMQSPVAVSAIDLKNMRDPFKQLVGEKMLMALKPDIETIPVDQFRLVAVLTGPTRVRALLRGPDNKLFTVYEGEVIGTRGGHIRRIEEDRVVVQESLVDLLGERETVSTDIPLQPEKGVLAAAAAQAGGASTSTSTTAANTTTTSTTSSPMTPAPAPSPERPPLAPLVNPYTPATKIPGATNNLYQPKRD